jgi:SdrD B-like domain
VFDDVNRNGIQDTGETGVQNVTATLTDADGNPATDCSGAIVTALTTDTTGAYLFTNLPAGSYKVTFSTLPTGYVFSPADATTGTDASDSDANVTTGMTGTYTLAAGETNLTVDAGINKPTVPASTVPTVTTATVPVVTAAPVASVAPATAAPTTVAVTVAPTTVAVTVAPSTVATVPTKVTGVVFVDTNKDGIQNPGEKSLPNVTVEIRDPQGKVVGTTTTDSNGSFTQPVPTDGTYTVTIISGIPPEYSFLTDQQTTVKVLGTTAQQAVFRVITEEVSAVAFTGSDTSRNLLVAFGSILIGLALLGSLRLRKEQA